MPRLCSRAGHRRRLRAAVVTEVVAVDSVVLPRKKVQVRGYFWWVDLRVVWSCGRRGSEAEECGCGRGRWSRAVKTRVLGGEGERDDGVGGDREARWRRKGMLRRRFGDGSVQTGQASSVAAARCSVDDVRAGVLFAAGEALRFRAAKLKCGTGKGREITTENAAKRHVKGKGDCSSRANNEETRNTRVEITVIGYSKPGENCIYLSLLFAYHLISTSPLPISGRWRDKEGQPDNPGHNA